MEWVNAGIQGILLGGVYALFAAGLALVFGTMRLCNLAHGDLTVLPAYFALLIISALQFNPFYSIPITMAIMFVFGYLLQRGLFNFVIGRGDSGGIIVSFGLMMVLQNAFLLIFSANSRGFDAGRIEYLAIKVTESLAVGWMPVIIFLTSLAVIAGLQIFLNRTRMGCAFRAVSDDQDTARLLGINNKHVWAAAMGVSLLIVAVGGVMMAIRTNFDPLIGSSRLIFAFEAVIIGGMGSGWGTLLGGIILGVAQTLGAQALGSEYSLLTGHVIFVLVLVFRPQGLLARTVVT